MTETPDPVTRARRAAAELLPGRARAGSVTPREKARALVIELLRVYQGCETDQQREEVARELNVLASPFTAGLTLTELVEHDLAQARGT
jgi:hypothetical protein